MAKLKGPLFSLGASQQLGKALVFFPWKGLNVVREYVIPANPKTALQTTQRGYLTAAVAKIHDAQGLAVSALGAADVTAYALWASVVQAATTWFNQACRNWLDVKVAGKTPVIYRSGIVMDTTAASINIDIFISEETGSDLAAGKFYFGISKTALINSKVATILAGDRVRLVDEDCSAFLTAGTKYYFQFRPDSGDPCEGANSGIYHFVAT